MVQDPKVILAKSDDELMVWALSGEADSYVHRLGETAMNMRSAIKMVEASKELAAHTRILAISTWGIVVITLLTQLALIYFAAIKG